MPVPLPESERNAHQLARLELLSALSPDALEALATEVEWLRVHAGEVVFNEGEAADSACFVLRGRLRASTESDGSQRVIGEIASGQPVGELGLLAGVSRTATVRAVRDTDLIRLPRATLDTLLQSAPEVITSLVRVIATRAALSGRSVGDTVKTAATTVALVATEDGVDMRAVSDRLVRTLERHGAVLRWRSDGNPSQAAEALKETLDAHDRTASIAVLEVHAPASDAAVAALRQADRILVLADADRAPGLGEVGPLLSTVSDYGCDPRVELVLLHPASRALPSNTRRRLAVWPFAAHHHVRKESADDFDRLGRAVREEEIGLVLGGGGGRGMAHIGVWRAITEASLPIDRIAGASVGAVIGAQIAAGWSSERMHTANRAEWSANRVVKRPAFPLYSLLSPSAGERMVERFFGHADLEDLWLPCQVATVDLTRCCLSIRDTGPVARWTLASATPPGIWPPVVDEDGALFVDGAVIDNLPVVPMKETGARHVIAVNVSRQSTFSAPPGTTDAPRLGAVLRQIPHALRLPNFPSVLQTLNRTALVTGLAGHARARELCDLFLTPPVEHISLNDYGAIDDAVRLGYESARDAFAERADALASWT